MSVSLYRKYRPQDFASVVGQKTAVEVLTKSLEKSRIGHAYLFSGSRGCGKTSIARIFAKALNCLDPQGCEPCGKCRNCEAITAGESLDVIEIDGASNNGVDNIRGLRENVTLSPFSSRYKVYIIDEVHMLSQGAFNALLKTLEEPPEYVVFILATTEPHKVPVTIRSRCQHIPFHSISPDDIFSRLSYVCTSEGLTADPDALREISRQADGALRDALSLLEQVAASGEITLSNVEAVFGAGSRPALERWVRTLREDMGGAYTSLRGMFDAGASGVRMFEEMFSLVRDLWLVSKWPKIAASLPLSESEKDFLREEAKNWTPAKIHNLLSNILNALTQARLGVRPDILLGMFMFSLEAPAPATAPEVIAQPTEIPREEPKPQAPDPPKLRPKVTEYDHKFKDELLEAAREKNFVVYCALFDVRPAEFEGALLLEAEHSYCYQLLRVDKNAAALSEIFSKYNEVYLRFGSIEYLCPKPAPIEEAAPIVEAEGEQNSKVFDYRSPEPKAEDEPATSEVKTVSAFSKIRGELLRFGVKPEVLFIKHKELQEQDDEPADYDADAEGETEE